MRRNGLRKNVVGGSRVVMIAVPQVGSQVIEGRFVKVVGDAKVGHERLLPKRKPQGKGRVCVCVDSSMEGWHETNQ